ncbi:MAG: flagellar filament outer layer protein FlaA [Treponema sp.]|nr:flagellar filament outer layer protein FlaA [Treponema sp.]
MKKLLILVVITMFTVPLFAEEGVLIDFSMLTADINVNSDTPNQNRHTLMDYGHVAGGSFTAQQKSLMMTSLAIENWEVTLNASARSVNNMTLSFTREAASREFTTVMGVRILFPVESWNSSATIRPPFEIPAYEVSTVSDDGTIQATGNSATAKSRFESQEPGTPAFGVIKNVGVIREVAVRVYGLNFPHGLYVSLIDGTGTEKEIFMGNLRYDGWGELRWRNPAYLTEIRNRDIRIVPLYPFNTPFIKFGGFRVERNPSAVGDIGGDFVTYFKDVSVIYDLAVLDTGRDIDDEATWNIIQTREEARKVWEMERFGQNQVLRYLETERQASEAPFGDPSRSQQ